jgi:NAD(P)H-hydrate epimerase
MKREVIASLLHRKNNANKYDFGHVLVVGGSPGMVGAPLLSAMAALRIGAGLVTIASHADVVDKLEKRVLEVMTLRVSDESIASDIASFVEKRRVSAVVVGPGMDESFASQTKDIVATISVPLILDAGAFVVCTDNLDALAQQRTIIATPHDGEFKKFSGVDMPSAIEERKTIASQFAQEKHIILVAKGSPTIVAHPDGNTFENTTGNPGLATAGTGDVLTGMIAGLIAQGIPADSAAQLGVYLHGLAGDLAADEKTQTAMIASDVIDYIPKALLILNE